LKGKVAEIAPGEKGEKKAKKSGQLGATRDGAKQKASIEV
jgi:hypothetical protein